MDYDTQDPRIKSVTYIAELIWLIRTKAEAGSKPLPSQEDMSKARDLVERYLLGTDSPSIDLSLFRDIKIMDEDLTRLVSQLSLEREAAAYITGDGDAADNTGLKTETLRAYVAREIEGLDLRIEERVVKTSLYFVIFMLCLGAFSGNETFFQTGLFVGIASVIFRLSRVRWSD